MRRPTLNIELTDNGAIVEIKNHADYNEGNPSKFVYAYDEDNRQSLLELMYVVNEFCDLSQGRYSKERIHVNLAHGDKYECIDANCPICKEEDL